MFKWIENLIAQKEKNESYIKYLQKQIDGLWEDMRSPLACVTHLLGRPIKWIETDRMEYDQKVYWYNEAQSLLRNKVFQSICGKTEDDQKINGEAVKDLIEHIARSAKTEREMDYWRAKIAGVELIREMAESIIDPTKEENKDSINDVI